VGPALTTMGHRVQAVNGANLGGVQVIQVVPSAGSLRYYRGGSDFRKDGQAVGW
jgi:gamma-glutamyltranspeptidase / glutathione hydrolase